MYGGNYSNPSPFNHVDNSSGYNQRGSNYYQEQHYYPEEKGRYNQWAGDYQQPLGAPQTSQSWDGAIHGGYHSNSGISNCVEDSLGYRQGSSNHYQNPYYHPKEQGQNNRWASYYQQPPRIPPAPGSLKDTMERLEQAVRETEAIMRKSTPLTVLRERAAEDRAMAKRLQDDMPLFLELLNAQEQAPTMPEKSYETYHETALSRDNFPPQTRHEIEEIQSDQLGEVVEEESVVDDTFEGAGMTQLDVKVVQSDILEARESEETPVLAPILAAHESTKEVLATNLEPPELHSDNNPVESIEHENNEYTMLKLGLDDLETCEEACRVAMEWIKAKPVEDQRVLTGEGKKLTPVRTLNKLLFGKLFRHENKAARRGSYPPPFKDRSKRIVGERLPTSLLRRRGSNHMRRSVARTSKRSQGRFSSRA